MGSRTILILSAIAISIQSCFLSGSHKGKLGYVVDMDDEKLNIVFNGSDSSIYNIGYSRIKSDIIETIIPNTWKATKYGGNTVSIVDTIDINKDNIVITVVDGFSDVQELMNYKEVQVDSMLMNLVSSSSSKTLYKGSIDIYKHKLTLERADKTYEQECIYFFLYKRSGILSACLTVSHPNIYDKSQVFDLVIGQLIKNIYSL